MDNRISEDLKRSLSDEWKQAQKDKLNTLITTELAKASIGEQAKADAVKNISNGLRSFSDGLKKHFVTVASAGLQEGEKAAYERIGVEQYKIDAENDRKTCDICSQMENQVFNVSEFEIGKTAPPFHFNCRCMTVPVITSEIAETLHFLSPDFIGPLSLEQQRLKSNAVVGKSENAGVNDPTVEYIRKSLGQVFLGHYSEDDTTLLGTLGQIGLSLVGVDIPADVRDLVYDLSNWEWTWEHSLQTGLDGIGLLPLIGALKNTDEVVDLIKGAVKNSDGIGKVAKKIELPKAPKTGSLTNVETRRWYLDAEAKIPNLIDKTKPLEQQARQAFELRNQFRTQAREAMLDKTSAEALYKTDPNMTWSQIVDKYRTDGFSGDALWQEIIRASTRSRSNVNRSLGLH